MSFQDKALNCVECGKEFTYAASEQELHKSLGYMNEPKRCGPCREAKKRVRGDRFQSDDRPRQTFSVICAECGKEAQVPFKPRGDKPVYCRDCFSKKRSSY
ncbi:MAG: zinc-binding protein [Planctomycetes bacterium RBG_16_59_8]|nr:MAG: zinc-binding protein [Planctomycetes bacterium RBG_16_59_8]